MYLRKRSKKCQQYFCDVLKNKVHIYKYLCVHMGVFNVKSIVELYENISELRDTRE